MSDEDRQKPAEALIEQSKPTKKVKSISHGWASDTDPIYTSGGWNFLMGKNLNPHIKPKNEDEEKG
jgi:hypothetical protein